MSKLFLLVSFIVCCYAIQEKRSLNRADPEPDASTDPTDTDTHNWFDHMTNVPQAAYPSEAEVMLGADPSGNTVKKAIDLCSFLQLGAAECSKKTTTFLQSHASVHYRYGSRSGEDDVLAAPPTEDSEATNALSTVGTDTNDWFKDLVNPPEAAYPSEAEQVTGAVDANGTPQKAAIDLCSFLSTEECTKRRTSLIQQASRVHHKSSATSEEAATISTDTNQWFDHMVNLPEAAYSTDVEKATGAVDATGAPQKSAIDLCSFLQIETLECHQKHASLLERASKFNLVLRNTAKASDSSGEETISTDTSKMFEHMITMPESAYPSASEQLTDAVDADGTPAATPQKAAIDLCSLLQTSGVDCRKAPKINVCTFFQLSDTQVCEAKQTALLETFTRSRRSSRFGAVARFRSKADPPADDAADTAPTDTDTNQWFDHMVNLPEAAYASEAEKVTGAVDANGTPQKAAIDLCSLMQVGAQCTQRQAAVVLLQIMNTHKRRSTSDPVDSNTTGDLQKPVIQDSTMTEATGTESIAAVISREPVAADPPATAADTMKKDGVDICSMLSKAECARKTASLLQTKIARRIVSKVPRRS